MHWLDLIETHPSPKHQPADGLPVLFFSLKYDHFYENHQNYYLQRLLSEAGLEWQRKRTPSEKHTATCLEVS